MDAPTDDDARFRKCGAGADLHRELLPDDHPARDEVPPLWRHPHQIRIRQAQARRRALAAVRISGGIRVGSPLATWVPGIPNFTPGRAGHSMSIEPRFVVCHTMVACEPSARARFVQPAQQASSTYYVKLDGTIGQYVSELDAPWTNSTMYDEPGANLDSITIEHEDCGDYNGPRTPALYSASARLVQDICSFWGIPIDADHIIRHRQCAHAATACPDSLDVERIIAMAAGTTPLPEGDDMDPVLADMIRNLYLELGVGPDGVTPGGVADLLLSRSKEQGEQLKALQDQLATVSAPTIDPAAVQDALKALLPDLAQAVADVLADRLRE